MDRDEHAPGEGDGAAGEAAQPAHSHPPPGRPLSGIRLWLRLVLSVLLSPLMAIGFAFDTVTTGSAGTAGSREDDAKLVDWWYEPFATLSARRGR